MDSEYFSAKAYGLTNHNILDKVKKLHQKITKFIQFKLGDTVFLLYYQHQYHASYNKIVSFSNEGTFLVIPEQMENHLMI